MGPLRYIARQPPPSVPVGGIGMTRAQRIALFDRRIFDLDLILAGQTESIVAAKAVRLPTGGQARVHVRLHDNAMGASRSATVRVVSEAPSRQEPSVDFVASTDAGAVQFDDTISAPNIRAAALTPG